MSELERVNKLVVSYCEIPDGIIDDDHWLNEHRCDAYVECHLDDEPIEDLLDNWLIENYPELKDEESFFIHMDY